MSNVPPQAGPERQPNLRDQAETAPASTLRPGDLLNAVGDAFELVTAVRPTAASDPPRLEVRTAVARSATAWLLPPDAPVRVVRGNLQHPAWCDEAHCLALDPVISHHKGAPIEIERGATGDPRIRLQLWQASDEPPETAHTSLVVTVDNTVIDGVPDIRAFDLEWYIVAALAAELQPLAAILQRRGAS